MIYYTALNDSRLEYDILPVLNDRCFIRWVAIVKGGRFFNTVSPHIGHKMMKNEIRRPNRKN